MSNNGDSFGSKLQRLRVRQGKSQRDLADELTRSIAGFKISQANVSHLERRHDAPRQDILDVLAKYFGVPVDYFYRASNESYEARKSQVANYFDSLQDRPYSSGVFLHTDGNKSGDRETLYTTENLRKFYRSTGILED